MDLRLDVLRESRGDTLLSPRISVIIPARNDPKRLSKCLAAVSQSRFLDFEVIVADDGSTDDTPIVAESMGARVVRLPRQSGAAAARNAAAEIARGTILMFVDADVCIHPDTLDVASAAFDDRTVDAIFGSYDLEPGEPNLLSQYKNLAHRYYHQTSAERVSTFWTGCGAIRRDVFNTFKFDAKRFTRPSIEDIDLGARLTRAGKKILINKKLQATHLKHWSLSGIIRSDLFDRAIPWTRLIHREKDLPGDLNLGIGQRLAAMLTALAAAVFAIACIFRPWLLLVPVAVFGAIQLVDRLTVRRQMSGAIIALLSIALVSGFALVIWYAGWWAAAIIVPLVPVLVINHRFYRFFIANRGWLFAAMTIPMQLAYYLYSLFGFAAGTALHWRDTPEHFDDPRVRIRLYVAITAFLYVTAWSLVLLRSHVHQVTMDFAVSDATGYYAYLPSLVIDGDLKFENQLEVQYPVKDEDYSEAMKHNRWPTGVALSIAPAFFVGHVLSIAAYGVTGMAAFKPHGYSLIYFVCCVAWAMGLGTLGMIAVDRVIDQRLRLRGVHIFAAVVSTWIGTNYVWYYTREPLLAHMIGASWVIFCIYLIHRIETMGKLKMMRWWHLPLLMFCGSMAYICRKTNAYMFPVFAYLLYVLIKEGLIWRALKLTPLMIIATAPLLVQILVQKAITGQVVAETVESMGYTPRERFYWTQPALLRSLFSSRHGMYFTTPLLLFATWGFVRHLIKSQGYKDGLLVCFGLSALVLWYINSAWYAWWFGPSVGNRGFVELAGLFAIGFALAYAQLGEFRPRVRRVVIVLLLVGFTYQYALIGLKLARFIEDNQTLIPLEDRILQGRWKRI